jgi:hypothetical protein
MQWDRLCAEAAKGNADAAESLRHVDVRRLGDKADEQARALAAHDDPDRPRQPRVSEAILHQALGYALAEYGAGPRPLQFRRSRGMARPPWRGTRVIDPLNVELPDFFEVLRRRTFTYAIMLIEEEFGASRPTDRRGQPSEEDHRRRALRAYLRGERSAEATRLLLGLKTPGAVRTAASRLAAEDKKRYTGAP